MPQFNYPPTIPVLQALVRPSLAENLNNISKAVRLWYILQFLATETLVDFTPEEFTDSTLRDQLYKSSNSNRDKKPNSVPGCICTKGIKDILFGREPNPEKKWAEWKQSFISSYKSNMKKETIALDAYLLKVESEKAFEVTGKTIAADLKSLSSDELYTYFLQYLSPGHFRLLDEFPPVIEDIKNTQDAKSGESDRSAYIDRSISLQDPPYLMDDFLPYAYLFSEPIRDVQRFYIHADYNVPSSDRDRVHQYQRQLRENWKKDNIQPCKLKYNSASRRDKAPIFDTVVYPICLYYYQRSFYLCAFGSELEAKSESQSKSNWYNYRLDRIEELKSLDWDKDRDIIPDSLREKRDRSDDPQLIQEVKDGIDDAYGFDFYLPLETMMLRFDREFHDRYIKNTFRHLTFKPILKRDLLKAYPNLITTVNRYPDSAYYKMNYRVGDNSVIMRLRAWGQNVEVLAPIDLRKRMYDDMKNNWNIYQEDIYPE